MSIVSDKVVTEAPFKIASPTMLFSISEEGIYPAELQNTITIDQAAILTGKTVKELAAIWRNSCDTPQGEGEDDPDNPVQIGDTTRKLVADGIERKQSVIDGRIENTVKLIHEMDANWNYNGIHFIADLVEIYTGIFEANRDGLDAVNIRQTLTKALASLEVSQSRK